MRANSKSNNSSESESMGEIRTTCDLQLDEKNPDSDLGPVLKVRKLINRAKIHFYQHFFIFTKLFTVIPKKLAQYFRFGGFMSSMCTVVKFRGGLLK